MSKQQRINRRQFAVSGIALSGAMVWRPAASAANPTAVELRPNHAEGDTSRVTLTLEVNGQLRQELQIGSQAEVQPADPIEKKVDYPLSVGGRVMYDEVLRGARGRNSFSRQSVRYYHHAAANINVGNQSDKVELNADRRLIVAQDMSPSIFCIDGPISREELDVVNAPGNSLIVDQLLPDRSVRLGEEWTQESAVMASLLVWDEVSSGDVTCKLEQVSNGLARVSMSGSLSGTSDTAESSIQLQGEFRYDIHWGRITWLQLDIDEQREAGLVHPGSDVAVKFKMRIEPLKSSTSLTGEVVASAWRANPDSQALLTLSPRSSAVELVHDRRWHMTGDFPRRTVLRCLNKEQLLAQLNVTELAKLPAGRQLSLEEFQKDIQGALGQRFREFVSANKDRTVSGFRMLRVVAKGVVDDVPIQWVYYHLNNGEGRRVAHVYILESENIEEFADSDREMVAGFQFASPAAPAQSNITSQSNITNQSNISRQSGGPTSRAAAQSNGTSGYPQTRQATLPGQPVR